MLTEAFQPRAIYVADIIFDCKSYGITELTVRIDKPSWLSHGDMIIDIILPDNEFSENLENWMARHGGEIPSVDVNLSSQNKTHKVANATPANWSFRHVTLVGGQKYTLQHSLVPDLIKIDDEQLAMELVARNIKRMKIEDPMLERFEFESED